MSNIQTGAERMPHDLSHLGFLAGQIGRLITISTTPVIAGDSFEMDAVGALRLSPLRRGLAIEDRKSGSAGMPRPISYAVFCLKKKKEPFLVDVGGVEGLVPTFLVVVGPGDRDTGVGRAQRHESSA